ncbi:MAG: family 43 glycosylhydrolase [Spirochaetales bacterium]|nr:family 43 glycosylhydrolase [Spirochaetales bacterium]
MKKERFFTNISERKSICIIQMIIILFICALNGYTDNPIVNYVYTADPAGFVANNRLYVICSHDLNDQTGYDMHDYYLFSSADLINWQDHGIVFDARRDTSWAWLAYAPDMVYRDGKYYLYFPNGADSIGVVTGDSPEGPFTDPLGTSLVNKNMPHCDVQWCFDPGVFVDDDGQAYLYFGGGGPGTARVIRLNNDMISVSGEAVTIDAPKFFEASYMHKRNGIYYFSYSSDFSEGAATIEYMTSDNPMTGFEYQGTILANPWDNLGNNNHHSIVEYDGQWYIFYHNRAVSDAVYQRSVCIDYLYYNSDGTIRPVNATQEGVNPGVTSNPSPAPTPIPTGCEDAPEWKSTTPYESEGIVVKYNGNLYENKWYSLGDNPEENSGEYDVWIFIESCDPQNTTTPTTEPTTTPVNTPAPTATLAPNITLGDVNADGVIDIVDALLIAQYYVDLNPAIFNPDAADTNCDDFIDIVDALLAAQYYVGLINNFC